MLGYLGIRSYKLSVEKLKTNKCIEEIETLSRGIQFYFQGQRDYGEFNYKQAVSFKLIPKDMFKEGFTEATNAYMGGVDFFYSSLTPGDKNKAFEISFQGLSRYACVELVRMNWGSSDMSNLIAVAGYAAPTRPAFWMRFILIRSRKTSNHAISLWPMKRLMSVWTSWKASAAATATTVRSYGNSGKRRNGRRRPGRTMRRQC